MKQAIISPIPKKILQFQPTNKRRVFIVNSVRAILIILIYNSKYNIIDSNMSETYDPGNPYDPGRIEVISTTFL